MLLNHRYCACKYENHFRGYRLNWQCFLQEWEATGTCIGGRGPGWLQLICNVVRSWYLRITWITSIIRKQNKTKNVEKDHCLAIPYEGQRERPGKGGQQRTEYRCFYWNLWENHLNSRRGRLSTWGCLPLGRDSLCNRAGPPGSWGPCLPHST